ncbi:MAG: CoA transferase [Gammaproteobacteria bacterium]
MNKLLHGLQIVEGSAFVAAPLGGMTLAQLGADVIRFDPIGGGIDARRWPLNDAGNSLYWAGLNKSKRSIMLDIRQPEGQQLACSLIAQAGIFLTNFPARGWLSYEALRQHREDLIMVNITGSRDGTSAVDYTVNAATGFAYITGDARPDHPVNNALPAWDVATGHLAALAVLAAERHRRSTGEGQLVTLPLMDVALAVTGHLGYVAEAALLGQERPPSGNDVYGAFGRDFVTRDGQRIMLVAISARQWRGLCEATGLGEKFALIEPMLEVDLNDEGDRYRARHAIAAVLEPWCAAHDLSDIADRFDAHGVCWGRFQRFTDLVNSPLCDQPLFEQVEQPGIGRYPMPGSALEFSACPRVPVQPAPVLGQHTEQILSDVLGLDSATIAQLYDSGVVAGAEAGI